MSRFVFLILFLLFLGSYETTRAVEIRDDRGGRIVDYAIKMLKYRNKEVRISGKCYSACTLYLSLSKVCVYPDTVFGFHKPYSPSGDQTGVKFAESFMMNKYPEWVKSWIKGNGGLTKRFKYMPYSYTKRHTKECKKGEK